MTTQASVPDLPRILLVPGADGFADWQIACAEFRPGCLFVDMPARTADLRRNHWLGRLDRATGAEPRPVVVAAHGLGALAVAWWGGLMGRRASTRIRGALLVAPAGAGGEARELGDFAPLPSAMLPFPSIVATGEGDPVHARACAAEWVSDQCDTASDALAGLLDLLLAGGPGLSRYAYRPEPAMPSAGRPVRPEPRPIPQRL